MIAWDPDAPLEVEDCSLSEFDAAPVVIWEFQRFLHVANDARKLAPRYQVNGTIVEPLIKGVNGFKGLLIGFRKL